MIPKASLAHKRLNVVNLDEYQLVSINVALMELTMTMVAVTHASNDVCTLGKEHPTTKELVFSPRTSPVAMATTNILKRANIGRTFDNNLTASE